MPEPLLIPLRFEFIIDELLFIIRELLFIIRELLFIIDEFPDDELPIDELPIFEFIIGDGDIIGVPDIIEFEFILAFRAFDVFVTVVSPQPKAEAEATNKAADKMVFLIGYSCFWKIIEIV